MRALQYIPSIVAFVAAVVGILAAPKWDPQKRGMARLTVIGRVTLGVALVALVASVVLTWCAQEAADFQNLQREIIKRNAHLELRLAILEMTYPFRHDDYGEDNRNHLLPKDVLESSVRSELAKLDLASASTYGDRKGTLLWSQVFQRAATTGSAQIDRTLQIYATYLDSDVLALVSELQRNVFLMRLKELDEWADTNRKTVSGRSEFYMVDLKYYGPIPDYFGYEEFWRLIGKLDSKLTKDETKSPKHP